MSFRQNTIFEPETCQIGPKVVIWTCPDLPRPVQEDKYLLQTSGNTFIFSEITPFPFVLANLSCFLKITRNMRNFIKSRDLVMSGPVQDNKYLLQTSGNTFIFQKLHLSIFVSKCIIFYKIMCFIKQIQ